jgi:hypothetical protein
VTLRQRGFVRRQRWFDCLDQTALVAERSQPELLLHEPQWPDVIVDECGKGAFPRLGPALHSVIDNETRWIPSELPMRYGVHFAEGFPREQGVLGRAPGNWDAATLEHRRPLGYRSGGTSAWFCLFHPEP